MLSLMSDENFRDDEYHLEIESQRKYNTFFKYFYYAILAMHLINPIYWLLSYRLERVGIDGIYITIYKGKHLKYCSMIYRRFLTGIQLNLLESSRYDFSDLVKYCPSITLLSISIIGETTKFESIYHLKRLKYLYIDDFFNEKLDLNGNDQLQSLAICFANLKNGIPYLPNLRNFTIDNFRKSDLGDLKNLPNLRCLNIVKSKTLESLNNISDIQHLEYISIYSAGKLKSLGDTGKLKNLRFLNLENCRNLSDISGLYGSESLEYIYFCGCNSLGDLSPLISCQNLVDLHLRVGTNLDSSYDDVIKALPKLRYSGLYGSRRRKVPKPTPLNDDANAQSSI